MVTWFCFFVLWKNGSLFSAVWVYIKIQVSSLWNIWTLQANSSLGLKERRQNGGCLLCFVNWTTKKWRNNHKINTDMCFKSWMTLACVHGFCIQVGFYTDWRCQEVWSWGGGGGLTRLHGQLWGYSDRFRGFPTVHGGFPTVGSGSPSEFFQRQGVVSRRERRRALWADNFTVGTPR